MIGRSVEDLRENAIAGTPAQVLDTLAAFAEAGAERVYLQTLDMTDLDHLRLRRRAGAARPALIAADSGEPGTQGDTIWPRRRQFRLGGHGERRSMVQPSGERV